MKIVSPPALMQVSYKAKGTTAGGEVSCRLLKGVDLAFGLQMLEEQHLEAAQNGLPDRLALKPGPKRRENVLRWVGSFQDLGFENSVSIFPTPSLPPKSQVIWVYN